MSVPYLWQAVCVMSDTIKTFEIDNVVWKIMGGYTQPIGPNTSRALYILRVTCNHINSIVPRPFLLATFIVADLLMFTFVTRIIVP